MNLTYKKYDDLPKLAWCAAIYRSGNVDVTHGRWVETGDDFFCEGAWSGKFSEGDLSGSVLMGSGAHIVNRALVVATPNHTLERLYVLRYKNRILVSNSLPFILAESGEEIDPQFLLYTVWLASIVDGLKNYRRWIPARSGARIWLYYHCNIKIGTDLGVEEIPKGVVQNFTSFNSYKTYLENTTEAIFENSSDHNRSVKYRPVTTISSGYDSPAAAVLAKNIGCTEALTFSQGRGEKPGQHEDSGAMIARQLGMSVKEYDRLGYLDKPGTPEEEFWGYGAQEVVWEDELPGALLFTGFHGGKVWANDPMNTSPSIIRIDPSGHNLTEFRLRVGWIHMPIPFIGCTSQVSICQLTVSEEMAPWSMDYNYDKPIARRLVEEAGIDRGAFGVKKRAVGVILDSNRLNAGLTAETYKEYEQYIDRHWSSSCEHRSRMYEVLKKLTVKNKLLNARISRKINSLSGVKADLPLLVPSRFRIGRFGGFEKDSLLFQWSIEKLMSRYRHNGL